MRRRRFLTTPALVLGMVLLSSLASGQMGDSSVQSTRVLFQSRESYISTTKIARMRDGSLIACVSRELFGPPYDKGNLAPGEKLRTEWFFTRSTDLGKTWSRWEPSPERVEGIPLRAGWNLVGGEELNSFYAAPCSPLETRFSPGQPSENCLYMSRIKWGEEGWSLGRPSLVTTLGRSGAIAVGLRSGSGELFCLYISGQEERVRGVLIGWKKVAIRKSSDKGRTWSKEVVVDAEHLGRGGKSYPVLTESQDGLLAFFYDSRGGDARSKPMMGGPQTIFRKSEDGGETWGQRRPLMVFTDSHTGRRMNYVKVIDVVAVGEEPGSDLLAYGRVVDNKLPGYPVFSGMASAAIGIARSYDGGYTWTDQEMIDWGGGGDWGDPYILGHFHRQERFLRGIRRSQLGEAYGYGQMVKLADRVLIVFTGIDPLAEDDNGLKVAKIADVPFYRAPVNRIP